MDSHGEPPLHRSQSLASGLEKASPTWNKRSHSRSSSTPSSRHSRQVVKDWEVMDDLQGTTGNDDARETAAPGICEGYLLKRRTWPLKGWHKRYFVLDSGILRYSKNQHDVPRGRVQGSLAVSAAVMSINKKSNRIDLDAGDVLYHMKAKSADIFYIWVTKLQAHRLYRKARLPPGLSQSDSLSVPQWNPPQWNPPQWNPLSDPQRNGDLASSLDGGGATDVLPSADTAVNTKVSDWLQQSPAPDCCVQELNRCESELTELQRLVQRLQALEAGHTFTNGELQRIISTQNLLLEKPKKSKSAKMWGHSRTLSRVEALGMPIRGITKSLSSSHLSSSAHLGASVPSIPDYVYTQLTPPTVASPEGKKIQQDICSVSLRVLSSLRAVHGILSAERLHKARESPPRPPADTSAQPPAAHGPASIADSAAEYYDASDVVEGGGSSEPSDESGLSDGSSVTSDPGEGHAPATRKYRASVSRTPNAEIPTRGGRRTRLPAPCPDNSNVGLMAILYNNIGKDLARVSMPAALNEPVNLLQRLCEELEYSHLLDAANCTADPYHRMVYVAAFAISGYASATFRNHYKPFNPVLGETYEFHHEDRGFRYISEQVCHHPPISACHADSENFSFWQDQRWKNKFWGKSLEILPTGMVNVTLPRYGDHYEWNKVVTCVHNVLSQQRYLEHYGEVTVTNLKDDVCSCSITFVKSRYWGSASNRNEVQGTVLDRSGSVVHRFGGLWNEGVFCDTLPPPRCVWKPNPQPRDHQLYYGFSSFALELNDITDQLIARLPPTDSRLRPDQRMLEEGRLEDTDATKDHIEALQRERRKEQSRRGEEHQPRFFTRTKDSSGRDVWVTNHSYWKLREQPGFANAANVALW